MDVIDHSDEQSRPVLDAKVADIRAEAAKQNVPSIAGECECCGFHFERLVRCNHPKDGDVWACARCRDKYKLPLLGK
jgi:predicted SprT family Zn-dependent metalloprotease